MGNVGQTRVRRLGVQRGRENLRDKIRAEGGREKRGSGRSQTGTKGEKDSVKGGEGD